jgi:spermidine synthase
VTLRSALATAGLAPGGAAPELAAAPDALPRRLMLAISFSGGFEIMALEVCALRVLQTYLGSSVVITGTLLSLVMALLAAGYYAGGWFSARGGSLRALLALLMAASLYALVISVFAIDGIGSFALSLSEAWQAHPHRAAIVPAAVLTLGLYGPPFFLLSTISPYWIHWRGSSAAASDAGVTSGSFMSLSTAGSIAGTAVGSYLSIPWFGVAATTAASSAVFLALVVACWSCETRRGGAALRAALACASVGALCAAGLLVQRASRDPSVIYEAESQYGQMRVVRSRDAAGRTLLSYHPSRVYTHSVLHPGDPLRQTDALMYLVPGLLRPPRDVLVLGSAAGAILRKLAVAFPSAKVTGVDLDPKVHEIARQIFQVDLAQSRLVSADARVFLRDTREDYDLIIVDLFSGEFIPTHCITLEFFQLVKSRLRAGGSLFINTNMDDVPYELPASDEPFRPLRHLLTTVHAAGFESLFENAFFHSVFAFPDALSISELRRTLLAQLRDGARLPALRAGAGLAAYTTVASRVNAERYAPFTDRWSPAPLIERKSNERALYAALAAQPPSLQPELSAAARVARRVLTERLRELERGNEPELRTLDGLYAALNQIDDPSADIDLASLYFRYGWELTAPTVVPASRWAQLAAAYARLYELGHDDDRESLLPELEKLTADLTLASP